MTIGDKINEISGELVRDYGSLAEFILSEALGQVCNLKNPIWKDLRSGELASSCVPPRN